MKNLLFLCSFLLLFLISCREEIKSERGGIDVVSSVYFDASKGLDKMQSLHVSSLNYTGDSIIERIPDVDVTELTQQMYFIKDSVCYTIGNDNPGNIIFSDIMRKQKPMPIENKKEGALFLKEKIPNYRNRKNLNDTVLFKKKYKRFEINSPWMYTRFYIYPSDTILPYSIYKQAERDYHGRLERIDSYNKKTDIFVTLQLIPRQKWDGETKEIFEFNQYVKSREKRRGKKF